MNAIKRLIPNKLKQASKYFLLDVLKIPYSRSGVPLEILTWLPKDEPVTFFDIGANVGNFSISFTKEYQINMGILIEPVSKLIPVLENKFPDKSRFKILNVAVSDVDTEADFYINEDFDFVSSLFRIQNEKEELAGLDIKNPTLTKINTKRLDYISQELQLGNIDLIKIDVQGAEHLVLKSGKETLKRTRLIYTEFSFKPLYENSSVFFDLYKTLYDTGFMLVNISPGFTSSSGELIQGDALFINKAMI